MQDHMAASHHHKVSSKKMGRRAPRPLPESDMFQAAASGDCEWLNFSLGKAPSTMQVNKQGLSVLHVAALHGQLGCLQLLLDSHRMEVNVSGPHGRRPLHMVLTAQSRPHSYTCLTYLLGHGAKPNVCTDEGLTPLHLAAGEGLKECTEALVTSGADTHVRDSRGHTPLDIARIWGHRQIARFLKDAMWQRDKQREMQGRRALQMLRQDLIKLHLEAESRKKLAREAVNEQKVIEWVKRKGLPLLSAPSRGGWVSSHACCLSGGQEKPSNAKRVQAQRSVTPKEAWNISPNPSRPPPCSTARPQEVRMSSKVESPPSEPDLRHTVLLGHIGDGRLHCITSWDRSPQPVPSLPRDVLLRGLFPAAFPSRICSPQDFQACSVLDLPHLAVSPGPDASPWTEVAMHLAEELQPGHY